MNQATVATITITIEAKTNLWTTKINQIKSDLKQVIQQTVKEEIWQEKIKIEQERKEMMNQATAATINATIDATTRKWATKIN